MKRMLFVVTVFAFVLAACGPQVAEPPSLPPATEPAATEAPTEQAVEPTPSGPTLIVAIGSVERVYSLEELQALGEVQATFREVTYVGVKLVDLLKDMGADPATVKAVKASASDGFSANYEAAQFTAEDTIVAYATVDGPLSGDDGNFRMVLPAEAGSMNVRMLNRITIIQ